MKRPSWLCVREDSVYVCEAYGIVSVRSGGGEGGLGHLSYGVVALFGNCLVVVGVRSSTGRVPFL